MASATQLSKEQVSVVEAILSGQNVIFMGQAGTGKSMIINEACRGMRESNRRFHVTATTGTASVNLDGAGTLHSFLGVGVSREETFDTYWEMIQNNKKTLLRLCMVETLIVDEVSFLSGFFLVVVDLLLRAARGKPDQAFGGIQMVFAGDYFQLPPVWTRDSQWDKLFSFEVFSTIGFTPKRFDLTRIFRQKDMRFMDALSRARMGRLNEQAAAVFQRCTETKFPNDGILPTVLFCRNNEVDVHNQNEMKSAPNSGETRRVTFSSRVRLYREEKHTTLDEATGKKHTVRDKVHLPLDDLERHSIEEKLLKNKMHLPAEMEVRKGMSVLFRANLFRCDDDDDLRVANGTSGVVVGWVPASKACPCVTLQPISAAKFAAESMVPPATEVVCRPSAYTNDEKEQDASTLLLPVVRLARGGHLVVVSYHEFQTHYSDDKYVQFMRLPFVAGWAISIHRSQGMTIDRLRLRLGGQSHFFPAQAYVAFSRVRGPEGLQLTGKFDRSVFRAQPEVSRHFGTGKKSALHNFGEPWVGPACENTAARELILKWIATMKSGKKTYVGYAMRRRLDTEMASILAGEGNADDTKNVSATTSTAAPLPSNFFASRKRQRDE